MIWNIGRNRKKWENRENRGQRENREYREIREYMENRKQAGAELGQARLIHTDQKRLLIVNLIETYEPLDVNT